MHHVVSPSLFSLFSTFTHFSPPSSSSPFLSRFPPPFPFPLVSHRCSLLIPQPLFPLTSPLFFPLHLFFLSFPSFSPLSPPIYLPSFPFSYSSLPCFPHFPSLSFIPFLPYHVFISISLALPSVSFLITLLLSTPPFPFLSLPSPPFPFLPLKAEQYLGKVALEKMRKS